MKKIFQWAFLIVLASHRLALANSPPAPQSLLAEVSILSFMIILTLVGGGYAVLKARRRMRLWIKGLFVCLAVLAILFSAAIDGYPAMFGLIFSIIALQRGLRMIIWGLRSRHGYTGSDCSINVNPWRLISAGGALILVTTFLMGMIGAFTGYPFIVSTGGREGRKLKDFVAYQLAYAQLAKSGSQEAILERKKNPEEILWLGRGYDFKLESDQKVSSFKVYVLPTRMPFFPYNYFTSQPSYLGDETGRIRMIYVHKAGKLCSPDAPVVMQVSEHDVQKKLKEILKEGETGRLTSE